VQESPTDHMQRWAREILEECEAHQVESMISRYRTKALDPSVDPFSRCEFRLRADFLDERLDAMFGLTNPPSPDD
jgi:hypothetical protein